MRRLDELEQALHSLERGLPPSRPAWYARSGALAIITAVLVATLAALLAAVANRGPAGAFVGALDVAMLLVTLAWFAAAIARGGQKKGVDHRSNGGSPV